MKAGVNPFRHSPKLILLGTGPKRSKRLKPPGRPSNSSISARVTKGNRAILNNNTRKTQSIRNETPQRLVQYFSKIQQEIQDTVNALQIFHYAEAAKLKRLNSAQEAIKKHLRIMQHEIADGYNTPGKDEHKN
jgi:hypothetical protein